ncbi:MAG: hypothetical protein GDA50_07945 [Alphaproteobacteria bacterium GM202ARS2]|nr:hypothetical protein [Alphaproteobacteria bacterium GM202ARS2]
MTLSLKPTLATWAALIVFAVGMVVFISGPMTAESALQTLSLILVMIAGTRIGGMRQANSDADQGGYPASV